MKRLAIALVASLATAAGCVSTHVFDREAGDAAPDGDAAETGDSMPTDGTCTTTVTLTSPTAATVYTNGMVTLQFDVSGCMPDRVELVVDGMNFAPLSMPYQYQLNAASLMEGMHSVAAVATVGSVRTGVSRTLNVVVDLTAPTITMRVPANGATGVFFRDPITVTFSEPMDQASVTSSTAQITADRPSSNTVVNTSNAWSTDGTTLTLTPTTTMATFPSTITATFGTSTGPGIRDLAGNSLAASTWTWSVPEWTPLSTNLPGGPAALMLRSDGTRVLVYVQHSPAGDDQLVMATWSGGTWRMVSSFNVSLAPMRVVISELSAVLDGSGNPYVLFVERPNGGGGAVYAAHFDGTAFSVMGTQPINMMAGNVASNPSIALGAGGNPVAAWVEQSLGSPIIARHWDGTAWQALGTGGVVPFAGRGIAAYPAIGVNSGGDTYIAALERTIGTGTASTLFFHKLASGASDWVVLNGMMQASSTVAYVERISMAFVSGLPFVAWTTASPQSIEVTTVSTGGTATSFPLVSTSGGFTDHAPWVRTLGGDLLLGFVDGNQLSLRRSVSGVTWSAFGGTFTDAVGGGPVTNQLSGEIDSFGEPVLAWYRYDNAGGIAPRLAIVLQNH